MDLLFTIFTSGICSRLSCNTGDLNFARTAGISFTRFAESEYRSVRYVRITLDRNVSVIVTERA